MPIILVDVAKAEKREKIIIFLQLNLSITLKKK